MFLQNDGISDVDPGGKKKKTKSNKGNFHILWSVLLKRIVKIDDSCLNLSIIIVNLGSSYTV